MKEKILMFIIGLLVGAILATGAFYVYTKVNSNDNNQLEQMNQEGKEPPEMPNEQNGEPPEKPDEFNNQSNSN